jgi:hypothetical protein
MLARSDALNNALATIEARASDCSVLGQVFYS